MTLLDAARTYPSVFDEASAAVETESTDTNANTGTDTAVETETGVSATAAETVVPRGEAEPSIGFADLGVPRALVRTLDRDQITRPFPIQVATIPDALAGRDVLGRGQTGSGKTLAFGLPMLTRIAASGRSAPRRPKGLVLVPTRELAMQVNDVLTPLAKAIGLFTKTAFGGSPYQTQIYALDRGVDVLVATPGRLADLIERGACSLDAVEVSVLDEADQMADMGFLPDVTALLEQTPSHAQRLLFSATLDGDVDSLVRRFMHDPVTHQTDAAVATVDTMAHHALLVPPAEKFDRYWPRSPTGPAAPSCSSRPSSPWTGWSSSSPRSASGPGPCTAARPSGCAPAPWPSSGRVGSDVLVATNVAARGIHVDGVSLVVHVDPPQDAKDYLHRAGRTARAGESGTVVTLVLPRQRRSTFSMMERAGVTPVRTEVTATAPALAEVTGARTPSGIPVPVQLPPAPRERRPGSEHRSDHRTSQARPVGAGRFEAERGPRSGARPYVDRRTQDRRPTRPAAPAGR